MKFLFLKRSIDLAVVVIGLVLLSPLLLVLCIVIKIFLGSPILFRQPRPGLGCTVFTLYKFRTMTNKTNTDGVLLSDGERLTRIGQFLRRTSLDELPSLFNVFKGEMSLVGPRPLLVEYLPLYSRDQARRHEVKPGITGWAQINGRNAISWEEKFQYDVWYVDNQSFYLDIRILLITVLKVFNREGITSNSNVTMEKYEGSK